MSVKVPSKVKWKRKQIKEPKFIRDARRSLKGSSKRIRKPRSLKNLRKNHELMKWVEFAICFVLCLPDYLGAAIPIAGDVWDFITVIALGVMFKNITISAFFLEFLPVGIFDLLPLEFIPWLNKYYRGKFKKKPARRKR
jgi:hypothetical protein